MNALLGTSISIMQLVTLIWGLGIGSTSIWDLIRKVTIPRKVIVKLILVSVVFSLACFGSWLLSNQPPQDFRVTSLKSGTIIHDSQVPLTVRGTYKDNAFFRFFPIIGQGGETLTVVRDDNGFAYPQWPPVSFYNGQWTASNIRPGQNIVELDFVFVESSEVGFFNDRINSGDYSGLTLPDSVKILEKISINSQVSG